MAVVVQAIIFVAASLMAIQSAYYLREPIVTSPGILPLVVSVAAATIAGFLLVADFLGGRVSLVPLRRMLTLQESRTKAARTAGWLGLASAYAITTPVIGFTWATMGFLVIALKVFARLAWMRTVVIAVAIATIVPLFFRYVFFSLVP